MQKEEAAFIKGYRVTEDGQVISPSGKILKINYCGNYPKFHTHISDKLVDIECHRLAAYQKFGQEMYLPGIEVRHIIPDRKNFKLDNILIGTRTENARDKPPEVRKAGAKKANEASRYLSDGEVKQLREDRKNGMLHREPVQKYKISFCTGSYIINNKTYRHV
jgi:hypothetical protein